MKEKGISNAQYLISLAASFALGAIVTICIYLCYKMKPGSKSVFEKSKQHTHISSSSDLPVCSTPVTVSNALAVIICIAEYDDNPQVQNLQGIKKDYINLHEFFKYLNFTVIPVDRKSKNGPYHWTEKELSDFLMVDVEKALLNGTDTIHYDALIVCVSCHGLKNSMITSDLKKIEKAVIHRAVSRHGSKVRELPRIFIMDACDGGMSRAITRSSLFQSRMQVSPPLPAGGDKSVDIYSLRSPSAKKDTQRSNSQSTRKPPNSRIFTGKAQ